MKLIKIKSIKKIGKRRTYDISVDRTHNFILSNNLLSHNSETRGLVQGSEDYLLMFRTTGWRDKSELCLDEDTLIKTCSKDIKIKDLDKRTKLLSYNSKTNKIEKMNAKKIFNGEKECFKINFTDGSYVNVTDEHKFFDKNNKIVKVKKLNTGDTLLSL